MASCSLAVSIVVAGFLFLHGIWPKALDVNYDSITKCLKFLREIDVIRLDRAKALILLCLKVIEKMDRRSCKLKPCQLRVTNSRERGEQIINIVLKCFAQAKSQSDFLELLREQQLHHYERNAKPTGVEHGSVKFRFSRLLNDKQFDDLPIAQSEGERIVQEIRSVLERQTEINNRTRDVEDRAR